jgi:hypothetical protein
MQGSHDTARRQDENICPGWFSNNKAMKHEKYRIAYKDGVLKDSLMNQRFQVVHIKKAENYDLIDALQNW